jgi:hypothetical protein
MKTHLLSLLCLLLLSNSSITAQLYSQKQKVVASERIMGGEYGRSVDISGNYAIVGLGRNDTDALGLDTITSAGAVYIFEKNSTGNWIEIQKLVAPDRTLSARFGLFVSISGNLAAIGSKDSYDAAGLNFQSSAGAVYIFERNTSTGIWNFTQKLVASDRDQNDQFQVVAISGNNLLVGAPRESDNSGSTPLSSAGAVYVFERNASTGKWTEMNKVVAPYRHTGDQFGYSVDLDGTDGIIGAPFDDYAGTNMYWGPNTGAAYRFFTTGGLSNIGYFDVEDGDEYGTSVAVSNGFRMVGSPNHVHYVSSPTTTGGAVYSFVGSNSNLVAEIYASDNDANDLFGSSISMDGNRMIIGAKGDEHSTLNGVATSGGSAYIFEKDGNGNWNEIEKITAIDRSYYDEFGSAIAISGTDILVGAKNDWEDVNGNNSLPDAGSAYFFHYCPARTSTINVSACNGYTSPSGRHYWTTSNTYTDILYGGSVLGCDSIITINLTVNTGTVDTSITVNGNILISNQLGATWQWIDCATNQPIPGAINRSFNFGTQNNTSYAVIINTNIGCVDTSACYPMNITSIAAINNETNFIISPNPTTGLLKIDLGKFYSNADIEIINTTGQLIFEKHYQEKEIINLNLSKILSGIYFVKIRTIEGKEKILKLIKS